LEFRMKTKTVDSGALETSSMGCRHAPTFSLGIDVRTKDAGRLRGRLARLKSTLEVSDGGAYREDPTYSQIHLVTTKTEDELDHWLWATKHGCDYVGVFQR